MNTPFDNPTDLHAWISEYYGKQLASSADLKTNACCAGGAPPAWIASALSNVHSDVTDRFYGCGYPIPHGVQGARMLDLGCGTGRDVFVLAQLVGEAGHVTGLDMTDEQLDVARRTQHWHAEQQGYAQPNTSFVKGYIEDLSAFADASFDVVVSNCVVNLSPRKERVLAEVFRVLKPGGEFYFSDVFADRRLPADIANDPIMYAECLGGALYEFDFQTLAKRIGFDDPRKVASAPITVNSAEILERIGTTRFMSVTWRLFRLAELDARCEDYGQVAVYRGGIPGAESMFWLDERHAFQKGRPEHVCGNTAYMLSQTRFAPFFEVQGNRDTHLGAHPCGPTGAASDAAKATSRGECGPRCC